MKKPVHVGGPEELREGDTFSGKTVRVNTCDPDLRWWNTSDLSRSGSASQLYVPFEWHPNGIDVERETLVVPVVWEGTVVPHTDCEYISEELFTILRVFPSGARYRVTLEEIEDA